MNDFKPLDDYVNPEDADVGCDNCDWQGNLSQVNAIRDPQERLSVGAEIPAGECPECEALAYLRDRPKALPTYFDRKIPDRVLRRANAYLDHHPGVPDYETTEWVKRAFQRGLGAGARATAALIMEEHGLAPPLSPGQTAALEAFVSDLRAEDHETGQE